MTSIAKLTRSQQNHTPVTVQEIEAVNRSFPAHEQTQMQLASKHVLAQIMAGDDGHQAVLTRLQMPAAQTNPHSLIGDIQQDSTSQTVSQLADDQPEWLHRADSLDSWILSNLNEHARRSDMAKGLQSLASPFVYHACTIQTPSLMVHQGPCDLHSGACFQLWFLCPLLLQSA